MKKDKTLLISDHLENIFIWWSGNSYYPEYALDYAQKLDAGSTEIMQNEMKEAIEHAAVDCFVLNELTGDMGFQDDLKAMSFFKAVYEYLFNNGREPDIDDYL